MSVRVYRRVLKDGRRVVFDLDVYEEGKRRRVTVTKPARLINKGDVRRAERDAEVKAREIEEQLRVDSFSFFEGKKRDRSDFIEYCRELARERGNPSVWTGMIIRLAEFAGGPVKMASVDAVFGQRFRRFMLSAEGIGNTTRKNNLATFKIAIRQAAKDGYMSFDIAGRIEDIKKDDAEKQFCTVEHLRRLDSECCEHPAVKVAFLFSCFTGLRLSDVEALRFGDVREIGGRLQIAYRQQKTKKHEMLPLGEQAVRYLHQAARLHVYEPGKDLGDGAQPSPEFEPEEKVFAGLPSRATAARYLDAWGRAAGLPFKLTFHIGRHTFITLGIEAGVNIKVLSGLAGHASVAMTEAYVHLLSPAKLAGVDALPVIGSATEAETMEV